MSQIVVEYIEAERRVKAQEEQLKRAKEERDRIEAGMLEHITQTGVKSHSTSDATAFLKRSLRVSLRSDVSKQAVRKAFEVSKIVELLREQCNANQLSAYIRGEVEAGRLIHPALLDVISIYEDFSVEVRKK